MEPVKLNLSYTLGLDIGMASVGAALLTDDHIHALHVRAFDKAETAEKGESLNKIRREASLARRRISRRANRLSRLRRLFKCEGLIASQDAEAFAVANSPWDLRAEGLSRKLDPSEWAAVLYHIVKHRGFQSNRKSEILEDEKSGQMLTGVSNNQTQMKTGGWRTVGEMAARDVKFTQAKRNKRGEYSHTFARIDLEDELHQLFSEQSRHGNPHSKPDFRAAVHDLLMERKPALSGMNLLEMVGKCTFETNEYRAPKASHTAERFVWLTRLNNTRITGLGVTRALTDDERRALLALPFTQAKLTYEQARRAINLNPNERFIGLDYRVEKDPEDAVLFEAKSFHKLHKAYEKAGLKTEWARDAVDPERLDTLAFAQTAYKDDREAREWLTQQGIETTIIEAVLTVGFSEFVRLSIKAMSKIIPHMEAGMRYDEAVTAAGYVHHSHLNQAETKTRYIQRISKEDFPNPVVYRALNQARKLVNAIIDEYGAPAAVHIELARNLSKPWDERLKIQKEQKAFRDNKEKTVERYRELFHQEPKKDQLEKLRLYTEQDGKCAYSFTPLDLTRLDEAGYVEIDHALPYSRSFDSSKNNKVLVLKAENQNKGNQTPYEYLGGAHDDPRWQAFEMAVRSNKKISQAKRGRLLRKDFGEKKAAGFRERNLTDTRYIARAFKTLVEKHLQLAEGSQSKRCVVVSGQLTAFLRARWGLLKVRADGDLHHALDAAVVAACSHSMVKRLADYSRRNELNNARANFVDPQTGKVLDIDALRALESQFPAPWPHFRHEMEAWLSHNPALQLEHLPGYNKSLLPLVHPVRVSRAPLRKGLGQAHQETIRSAKLLDQGLSSVKTPLENLKLKDMKRIVGWDDPRNEKLITAIRLRLETHGDDGKKAFKEPLYKPSKPGKVAPIVRTVNLMNTQKSGIRVRGGVANNGSMLRVDIFTDGKRFYAVPLYVSDVIKQELPNRAVVARKPEEEWTVMDENYRFLFSLHPNDWVTISFKKGTQKMGYFSSLNRAGGTISIWTHDRSDDKGKGGFIEGIGIKTALSVEKYHVDMLGHLYPVKQEIRQPLNHKRKG